MMYVNAAVCLSVLLLVIGLSVGHNVINFKGSDALNSAPLIDGHNDLAYNLYDLLNNNLDRFNFTKNLTDDKVWGTNVCNTCNTDLPRLRKGKVGAQFWAAYVDCASQYKDAVPLTMKQIDVIKRLVAKYPNDMQFVTEAKNIEEAWKNGKIASLIGVEGGHSMDSSLAILRLYYELGVRYMTLTHMCNTPWADASIVNDNSVHNLTNFGEAVIYEMNRLGMLVDLSHVSHNVMRHTLSITKAPIIFSHSSAFSVCHNYRNVPDDVLLMVKANNGVVMVNFYSGFVNCNSSRKATIHDVVDHINYIRNLIGADHVGIGADFDGVLRMPEGLEDVSKYPDLFDLIFESNVEPRWTKEELEKLAGRNLIRVFQAVENVRDTLAKTESPRQDIIDVRDVSEAEVISHIQPGLCQTSKEWDDIRNNSTSRQ
ncbi:Dipeptidase 1 [Eufriesea mexicana]|uniref:Dipeptidase n=3 Tax=Eufriesea mexicana TaxID=516756 RepID=A0A310S7B6_9HYME|nr:PREDICTED: dipeptidase 1-like isoform X2 [Eufriesea mexicana]XP_017762415.1 PREDICTED: dipeptidase 1-like isoform X2 [Eufriesea mexicana]OAD53707.1 Dipeptidase 1 [Eufriesea mexicana]